MKAYYIVSVGESKIERKCVDDKIDANYWVVVKSS